MTKPTYIVAIGTSAGGLEALISFFSHTPLDSVCYVIIPHLSVDFKSQMVEILSRYSTLEVVEAAEGMEVERNKVYLIPNTKYMGIRDGHLFMFDKAQHAWPHLTVDAFFTSLAEDMGNRSIGIVLSGAGSDGSCGAIAIEKAGGVMMVQEPADAKFDSMPKATLATSNTRYVFPSEALPLAIQQYVNENNKEDLEKDRELTEGFLTGIINLIKDRYPFDFSDYKLPTLTRRINKRMCNLNIDDENQFLAYLETRPTEIEQLISDFLIGVTSFFRDPEAFHILETDIIPQMVKQKAAGDFIKVWVAGCATGEEAYSFAILIQEYLTNNNLAIDVKIFATDINKNALDQAAKGIFSEDIANVVSPARLTNFFDKGEDNYRIKPLIRKMLIFARHDLVHNPTYVNVDLISCRNMLIYVKPILQKQILAKLAFGLVKKGFLFLGSSDNISIVKDDFTEINSKWKIYQNARNSKRLNLDGAATAPLTNFPLKFIEKNMAANDPVLPPDLAPGMTVVILKESGFCAVSVDLEGRVTKAFGDLSPYLKSERFNFNLQELLPETLAIVCSASLHKAIKLNQRVRINNISFVRPDTSVNSRVDLIVTPFGDRKLNVKGLMVFFKEVDNIEEVGQKGEDFNIDIHTKAHLTQLEEELFRLRQELLSSKEHVEHSKEALQAYNEELLSANEEMQSANEEFQSINEELETVNAEHKGTIEELTKLNDDLNNYFRSNINGQLFVDQDILLKKYSPGAMKHINIRERDIGRPLSNITTNIKFETLIGDIKKVLDNGETIIREIESNDGKVYQVMTSPYYKKDDKKIYGAIIIFYDISELKRTQDELDKTNKMLSLATIAAEMGTWSIAVKTRELTASTRLKEIFGFPLDGQMTFGATLAQVVTEQQPLLLKAIDTSIRSEEKLEIEFPVHRLEDGRLRWVRMIGSLTYLAEGKAEYLTGVMHDVTDHKLDDIRKNDFISIVSHELKTPLTSMKGYIQVLLARAEKSGDIFSQNALDRANKQINRMTSLINGFLNVSRLETGKIHLNRQTFQIDVLVAEIIEEVMTVASPNQVIILPGCSVFVNADREKIGQVINNLLSNAVKYSLKGGKIEISCQEIPDGVQVSIKDEGMGIPAKEQEKLFDRYYRVVSDHTKTVSGFGIGLYLCAEIIQRHKGKIWVESEHDKGSTFCFTLPLN